MCCNAMFPVSLGRLMHAADLHQDRAMASNTVVEGAAAENNKRGCFQE